MANLNDKEHKENQKKLTDEIEKQLTQKNPSEFLKAFHPKPAATDEAQKQMERAFKNQDASEEVYRNTTKNAIPDRYGDIDVKHPGEVDGKADNPDAEEQEKTPSKTPKLKPPGS